MKKHLILICLLVFFAPKAKAQFELQEVDTTEVALPKFSIKYFPSQLIGHFPAQMFGAEYMLNSNLGLEARYGVLVNRNVYQYDPIYYSNKSGFKSSLLFKVYMDRSEYRRGAFPYVFSIAPSDESFRPYFGIEVFYNKIKHDRERTYELSCGQDCSYFSEVTYGLVQNRVGGRFHVGFVSQIAGSVFLDCSVALGLMSWDVVADGRKPADYEYQYGYILEEGANQAVIPAADINLKLMFQLFR